MAANGFHQPAGPCPDPQAGSGARGPGRRAALGSLVCAFVRAVSCWARTEPTPSTELPGLRASKGPVLSQDAAGLKSIKGISKQITW